MKEGITRYSNQRGQSTDRRNLIVAYAMTISKSQGQSLDRAGICLWTPVFTHGQLYVASSRTGSSESTIYAVRSPEGMEPFVTKNIVFREILT
jgi:ATP-dependent DNA helicase PIF1